MARNVRIHVTNCIICAKRKAAKTCKAPIQPFPIAEYLWQRVAMDIVGPVIESYRGSKYILVLIDYVTRYVIAFPLKDITAQIVTKKFIQHVITKEGIPAQILTTKGIAGYYRKFINQFADIVHVLTQLTRSKVQWHWGTEEKTAFEKIKELLCTTPVLAYPDFSRPFIIHTDACGYGVGGILSQMPTSSCEPASDEKSIMDSREHPIAYTSKHLNDLQIKWCTTEKEAFAIYHTVKTFFPYLYGTTFTIVTDHASLKYLMGKRETTGRLARWSLYLQQFDMEIHYRPGKLHQNADALSRSPVYAIVTPRFFVDDWIIAQKEDKFCKMLMEKHTGKERRHQFSEEDSFEILNNGLLATAREKTVVPMKFQKEKTRGVKFGL